MDAQLKPCPFCGSAATAPKTTGGSDERTGYNFRVQISCSRCGAEIARDSHHNKQGWCDDKGQAEEQAIAAWNRRV